MPIAWVSHKAKNANAFSNPPIHHSMGEWMHVEVADLAAQRRDEVADTSFRAVAVVDVKVEDRHFLDCAAQNASCVGCSNCLLSQQGNHKSSKKCQNAQCKMHHSEHLPSSSVFDVWVDGMA